MQNSERAEDDKPIKRTRNRAVAQPAPAAPRRQRVARSYSTHDKLRACAAMLTVNREHPFSDASVKAARELLVAPNISKETLFSWMTEYRAQVEVLLNAPPTMSQVVQDTQNKVLEMWTTARDKALERLGRDDVLDKAAARDLAVIGGITQDHIHKMHKVSPERMNKVYAIIDACSRVNLDADVLLDDMLHAVQSQAIAQQKTINVKAEDSTDVS